MSQLSLIIPFGLPLPEMARDLAKALQAPALATLLSRSQRRDLPFADHVRLLPHEQWLCQRVALCQPGSLLVHPCHIEVTRKSLVMNDWRQLELSEADALALFEAALPLCEELGLHLRYLNAQVWQLDAADWKDIDTASLDITVGENLSDYSAEGAQARALRKLQNEIQMLWFQHPVNGEREARRQQPVNGLWIWAPPQPHTPATINASPAPYGLDFERATPAQEGLAYLDSLSGPALRGDWGSWLLEMQRLEQEWFAPALQRLQRGELGQLELVLSHRQALSSFTSSRLALCQFWRRPSLQALIP